MMEVAHTLTVYFLVFRGLVVAELNVLEGQESPLTGHVYSALTNLESILFRYSTKPVALQTLLQSLMLLRIMT